MSKRLWIRRHLVGVVLILGLFGLVGLLVAGVTASPDPDEIVAHWRFDEGAGNIAYDETANNNDGTIYDATWVDGISGKALSFDGVDDYVQVTDSSTFKPDNSLAIAAWIKPEATQNDFATIVGLDYGADGSWTPPFVAFQLGASFGTGSSRRPWFREAFGFYVISPDALTPSEWHLVVGTFDGSSAKLYVDGELKNSAPYTGSIHYGTSRDLAIGQRSPYSPSEFFRGSIDEVRIYNRALTQSEISNLYRTPSGFSDEFETSTLDPRWVVYDDYGGSSFSLTSIPGYVTISTTSPPDRDLYQSINFYSPRIMQPIYGDFTVETKVLATMDTSIQSGGIVAWKDQNNFLRLERAFRHGYHEILFIGTINGIWSMHGPEVSNPGAVLHIENINPTYLRLVRTDNIYSGYYSADGINWSFVANITMNTDYSLMAGLYNVNRGPPWFSSTSFTVSFDYFRIRPLQLEATVDIKPDTLNLKSRARWITAYIELPIGYSVGDIDVGTVMLLVGNGNVPAKPKPTKVGDHDHDDIPDLKVRFERGAVQAFMPSPGEYTLTIRGEVAGVPFEGSKIVSAIIRS